MNQLHLYDPTPPPATITWNPHKKQKKKKTGQTYMHLH